MSLTGRCQPKPDSGARQAAKELVTLAVVPAAEAAELPAELLALGGAALR